MSRGSGPTTSTPGSVMISLDEGQPVVDLALGEQLHGAAATLGDPDLRLHLSAMLSFCSVALKLTPAAAPVAALG